MPTYEYECTACGQHIEVFQRFAEDALTTCGACGGALRKVFHPAGIVFKGSGFYVTDSRSRSSSGGSKERKKEGSKEPSSSSSKDASSDTGGGATTPSSSSSSEGGSKASPPKDGSS